MLGSGEAGVGEGVGREVGTEADEEGGVSVVISGGAGSEDEVELLVTPSLWTGFLAW